MIYQRNRRVSFGDAFADFFKGYFDFKGYSTPAGHWFPVATIYITYIVITLILLGETISRSLRFFNSSFVSDSIFGFGALNSLSTAFTWIIILMVVALALACPLLASTTRRLRDVGFSNWAIVILLILNILLYLAWVPYFSFIFLFALNFILVSLPTNTLETKNNDSFSLFLFRQDETARAYYSQFANQYPNYNQGQNPNFNNTQFNGQNPNFNNTQFNGQNPNFKNGQFNGQNPNFNNAQFNGQNPNFNNTQFNGQNPNFSNAQFNGQNPNFNNAQFNGQNPNFNNAQFNGQNPNFSNAQFNGQNPNFNNAQFNGQNQQLAEQENNVETAPSNDFPQVANQQNVATEQTQNVVTQPKNENPFGDKPINKQ